MRQKIILSIWIAVLCVVGAVVLSLLDPGSGNKIRNVATNQILRKSQPSPSPTRPPEIPMRKVLQNDYHIFQTFNNCGPAALSMNLSYFDINISQQELGDELRPYKPIPGSNDDKSVTLEELGEKAQEYGLRYYHRPNGSTYLLEEFLIAGIPFITRTWLHPDEDIGHYRVVKGYDKNQGVIIQDDSYEGPNLSYEYEVFNSMWEKFNYEYLVIYESAQEDTVRQIIGEDVDEQVAWQNAKKSAEKILQDNPDDIYARFNLSIALYHLGQYEEVIKQYEQVSRDLPFRTLWYQIEPIDAYYQVADYDRVFEITNQIFESGNRAYAEAYVIRGKSYVALGQPEQADKEFKLAQRYNTNLIISEMVQ